MATKTASRAKKQTVVTEHVSADEVLNEVHGFMEDMSFGLTKRMLISTIASIACAALGVAAAFTLASMLSAAVVLYSGSAFLGIATAYFVAVVGFMAAMLAGSYVARYIAHGKMADDFDRLTSWVGSKSSSLMQRLRPAGEVLH